MNAHMRMKIIIFIARRAGFVERANLEKPAKATAAASVNKGSHNLVELNGRSLRSSAGAEKTVYTEMDTDDEEFADDDEGEEEEEEDAVMKVCQIQY